MTDFPYHFWDRPYVETAGAHFAGVFLALHPFIKVNGLRPDPWGYDFDFEGLDATSPYWALAQGPRDRDLQASAIKRDGHAVPWACVVEQSGLRDLRQLCQAYYSHFNRLVDAFNDRRAASRLLDFTIKNDLLLPEDNHLPALYEISIGRLFKQIGVETITAGHDWLEIRKSLPVETLLDPTRSIQEIIPCAKFLFSGGHEIVTVSQVDDPYTIICLSHEAAKVIDPTKFFEGFWADNKTDFNWWLAD